MSPEVWSIIATGIVILISNATTYRSLRREMNERFADLRREMNERIAGVQREVGERFDGLSQRMDRLSERMDGLAEQLGDVRERLGRVEGLLEGLGLTRRERAGKGRGDEQAPTPSRP